MVDKPLILKKLSILDEYLKQIGEYASISPRAYIVSERKPGNPKRVESKTWFY